MSDWFEARIIEDGVWAINEPYHAEDVLSYLVLGEKQAILIDTGMAIAEIHSVVEDITELPIMVVNTHSHYDHVGNNYRFKKIAIHRSEARRLERGIETEKLVSMIYSEKSHRSPPDSFDSKTYHIRPSRATRLLKDGDVLSLGNRRIQVLHTPGHSPGCICLWESARGLLFTGDTVYDSPIYAQLSGSDFEAYLNSLNQLCSLVPQVHMVLPSHSPTPLEPMFVIHIAKVFQRIAQGGVEYWFDDTPWGQSRVYMLDDTVVYIKKVFLILAYTTDIWAAAIMALF